MSAQNEKTALFIDGANLYMTAKSLGLDIDYKRLLREFQSHGHLLRAFYYTAVFEDQESVSIRPLIDWLEYNGYTVVTKAAKESVDHSGRRKVKGNMDIELAIDAMEIAPHIDRMVLFSGDGDFRSLVQAVQRRLFLRGCLFFTGAFGDNNHCDGHIGESWPSQLHGRGNLLGGDSRSYNARSGNPARRSWLSWWFV